MTKTKGAKEKEAVAQAMKGFLDELQGSYETIKSLPGVNDGSLANGSSFKVSVVEASGELDNSIEVLKRFSFEHTKETSGQGSSLNVRKDALASIMAEHQKAIDTAIADLGRIAAIAKTYGRETGGFLEHVTRDIGKGAAAGAGVGAIAGAATTYFNNKKLQAQTESFGAESSYFSKDKDDTKDYYAEDSVRKNSYLNENDFLKKPVRTPIGSETKIGEFSFTDEEIKTLDYFKGLSEQEQRAFVQENPGLTYSGLKQELDLLQKKRMLFYSFKLGSKYMVVERDTALFYRSLTEEQRNELVDMAVKAENEHLGGRAFSSSNKEMEKAKKRIKDDLEHVAIPKKSPEEPPKPSEKTIEKGTGVIIQKSHGGGGEGGASGAAGDGASALPEKGSVLKGAGVGAAIGAAVGVGSAAIAGGMTYAYRRFFSALYAFLMKSDKTVVNLVKYIVESLDFSYELQSS